MSREGELWSFFRALISQGTYIQMDYAAGKYKRYEEFSARLDAAARERVDEFLHGRQDPPFGMEAQMAERLAQETSEQRCTACGFKIDECSCHKQCDCHTKSADCPHDHVDTDSRGDVWCADPQCRQQVFNR